MKSTVLGLIALTLTQFAVSYEIDEYIEAANESPISIYENLHPSAKEYLKGCFERIRKDADYRSFLFLDEPRGLKKMSDEKIWKKLWIEHMGEEFYPSGTIKLIGTKEIGEKRST